MEPEGSQSPTTGLFSVKPVDSCSQLHTSILFPIKDLYAFLTSHIRVTSCLLGQNAEQDNQKAYSSATEIRY